MIMGITMFSCTMLLLGNFLADILYGICRSQDQTGKGVRYGEITDTTQPGRPEGGGFFKDRRENKEISVSYDRGFFHHVKKALGENKIAGGSAW